VDISTFAFFRSSALTQIDRLGTQALLSSAAGTFI